MVGFEYRGAEKGWRAFYVELTFADESAGKLWLTSGVSILPQELPH